MGRTRMLLRIGGVGLVLAAGGLARAAEAPNAAPQAPPEAAPPAPPAEGAPAEAPPGEKDWSLDLDLTYASKYVWRGINVTADPVLQPSIGFTYKGLTLNVWGNLDTTDVNGYEKQFNEIDYTLDYTLTLGKVSLSAGAVYYQFPQAHSGSTTEAYLGVGLDVLAQPTLTVYQDVHEHDGTYLALAFGHTFADVWKPVEGVSVSVEVSTSFGWATRRHNAFYYGYGGSAWTDAKVGLALPIAVGDHVTVTPSANCSWILDDRITKSLGDDTVFWAGLSVTFSF